MHLTRRLMSLGQRVRRAGPMPRVERFEDVPCETRELPFSRAVGELGASGTLQAQPAPGFAGRAAMDDGQRLRVALASGVRLATDGGAMLTGAGEVVVESLWDEEHFRRSFQRRPRLPPPRPLEGTHGSLISLWHGNFFHWILDALPRLASLRSAGLGDVPVIVPEPLSAFQRDSLSLAGLPEAQRTPFVGQHVKPDSLAWAPPMARIGHPTVEQVSWLRGTLAGAGARPRRRLYVSRGGVRRVLNEDELRPVLHAFDIEMVRPETLPFAKQVELFAGADCVVGAHGAGLTNCAFGQGMKLLELLSPAYLNPCFHELARAAGHTHWHLVGTPARGRGPARERPLTVDSDVLRATLKAMLG